MNLPLELVDKILQFDGRIKYRKGEFINIIHPDVLGFYTFILKPLFKKKINILKTIDTAGVGYYLNSFVNTGFEKFHEKRFYFEFEFDSLKDVGLCYDYYWGNRFFEICYYDLRNTNEWKQIRTTIN